jgi:hypothetical protein
LATKVGILPILTPFLRKTNPNSIKFYLSQCFPLPCSDSTKPSKPETNEDNMSCSGPDGTFFQKKCLFFWCSAHQMWMWRDQKGGKGGVGKGGNGGKGDGLKPPRRFWLPARSSRSGGKV